MNILEYQKVKNYNYLEYCDYLQNKYGIGLSNYLSKNWNKNSKVSRTKDGLYTHHKYEDHAKLLSTSTEAQKHPYEWQLRENLVYCDFLEHLFLHILICEQQSPDLPLMELLGFGGIVRHIVPELNDVYSGWRSKQAWQNTCHNAIINDKDVYLLLLKRFKTFYQNDPNIIKYLYRSYNEAFNLWSNEQNHELYSEIENL